MFLDSVEEGDYEQVRRILDTDGNIAKKLVSIRTKKVRCMHGYARVCLWVLLFAVLTLGVVTTTPNIRMPTTCTCVGEPDSAASSGTPGPRTCMYPLSPPTDTGISTYTTYRLAFPSPNPRYHLDTDRGATGRRNSLGSSWKTPPTDSAAAATCTLVFLSILLIKLLIVATPCPTFG